MARLNPAAKAEAERSHSEAEVIDFLTPKLPGIVTAPFDVEQTRPFFEAQYLKEMAHLDLTEEDSRADLERDCMNPEGYKCLDVSIE